MNAARSNLVRAHRCAGASLLEVLVAVSLLGVSLLGLAAVQVAALRDTDALAMREQAFWMAASVAEAMRVPELAAPVLARLRVSSPAALPGARISLADETSDVGAAIVHWARAPGERERAQSPDAGPCLAAQAGEPVRCIALPFASGGA